LVVEEVEDEPLHLERVAALDIGKAGLEACVRVPGKSNPARRAQEVRSFATTKAEILLLAAWLHEHRVGVVVMESTSDYWRAPFFRLEAEGFTCQLLDAKHVKALPGSPKTDKADCVWLAKVAEKGMAAKCFVPPEEIFRPMLLMLRLRTNTCIPHSTEYRTHDALIIPVPPR
jgi:transposase